MIVHRPKDFFAGFMCRSEPNDSLPFLELGEVYASSRTQVDLHQNYGWEICLQTKGHSEWTVKGEKASMGELSSYLIRPGIEHRSNAFAEEECHFYFVVFRDECIPEILKDRPEWNQDYLFSEESGDLIREMSIPKKWRRHACRLALQQLCIAFSRTHLTKSDLSITHIAVDLGFASGQHFSRIFNQRTGSTPRQFRNAQSNQTST